MLNMWSNNHIDFKKENTHRALDDIKESIEELRFYKQNFIHIPDNTNE